MEGIIRTLLWWTNLRSKEYHWHPNLNRILILFVPVAFHFWYTKAYFLMMFLIFTRARVNHQCWRALLERISCPGDLVGYSSPLSFLKIISLWPACFQCHFYENGIAIDSQELSLDVPLCYNFTRLMKGGNMQSSFIFQENASLILVMIFYNCRNSTNIF